MIANIINNMNTLDNISTKLEPARTIPVIGMKIRNPMMMIIIKRTKWMI